jgi:pimeloyl-ACP methyl ester carboxylesterase
MLERFKKSQPIHYTGIPRHMALWATANSDDEILHNPKFKEYKSENYSDGIAVYCVHGTADRSGSFSLIANRLLPNLPTMISSIVLVSFDQRGQGKGIEHFARQLRDKIHYYQHKDVIIMGHSRGGIIAATLAELLYREYFQIHGIFAICSPFGGSDYALAPATWYSSSVEEMKPNSLFLRTLNAKIRSSTIQYQYFAVENDSLVPKEAACVEEHKKFLTVLDRHGHLSVMSSNRMVEHIQKHFYAIMHTLQNSNKQCHP